VVHPTGAGTYTGAGTGSTVVPLASTTNVFPDRLPIKVGEGIGLDRPSTTGLVFGAAAEAQMLRFTPVLADGGAPRSPSAINLAYELLVNADVEPDCDSDGFGDESQDSDISTCIPDTSAPETTITGGPKNVVRTKKKRAKMTFTFASSEPGTFECSLDGAPFAPCSSPSTHKVKAGRRKPKEHTFQVRAIDAAGNLDPVPAADDFKAKRKKK